MQQEHIHKFLHAFSCHLHLQNSKSMPSSQSLQNEIEKVLTYQVAVMFLVNFSNITHQRYIFLSVNTPTELEKVITPVIRKVTYQWLLAVFLSVSKVTQKAVKFWEWYGFVQKADNLILIKSKSWSRILTGSSITLITLYTHLLLRDTLEHISILWTPSSLQCFCMKKNNVLSIYHISWEPDIPKNQQQSHFPYCSTLNQIYSRHLDHRPGLVLLCNCHITASNNQCTQSAKYYVHHRSCEYHKCEHSCYKISYSCNMYNTYLYTQHVNDMTIKTLGC